MALLFQRQTAISKGFARGVPVPHSMGKGRPDWADMLELSPPAGPQVQVHGARLPVAFLAPVALQCCALWSACGRMQCCVCACLMQP